MINDYSDLIMINQEYEQQLDTILNDLHTLQDEHRHAGTRAERNEIALYHNQLADQYNLLLDERKELFDVYNR